MCQHSRRQGRRPAGSPAPLRGGPGRYLRPRSLPEPEALGNTRAPLLCGPIGSQRPRRDVPPLCLCVRACRPPQHESTQVFARGKCVPRTTERPSFKELMSALRTSAQGHGPPVSGSDGGARGRGPGRAVSSAVLSELLEGAPRAQEGSCWPDHGCRSSERFAFLNFKFLPSKVKAPGTVPGPTLTCSGDTVLPGSSE